MSRLKIYRGCLILALLLSLLTLYVYGSWYLNTQIPDVFRVEAEGTQSLDLGIKEVSVQVVRRKRVIPGGIPVGVYLETRGVYVVGTDRVEALDGLNYEPAGLAVRSGDYILAVNGRKIQDKDDLISCVQENKDGIMILKLLRDREQLQVRVQAVQTSAQDYKLGLWVKDDIQGIGTLTYLTEDLSFGALGHGIADSDTGELLESSGGALYDTNILDIVKGKRGTPGEISGMITYSDRHIRGSISGNTSAGIFGKAAPELRSRLPARFLETAFKQEIRPGRAVIQSAVSGELKEYAIEIQEIHLNEGNLNKGMVFQVTDPELLSLTGGVIQGMSGSPIIQNGKIVGAVTHVLVNDPTRGYGIFIENMLEAAE